MIERRLGVTSDLAPLPECPYNIIATLANELIVILSGRSYKKVNAGFCIVGYFSTYNTEWWTGPVVVSKDSNSVSFYSGSYEASGATEFTYNGETYYYSVMGAAVPPKLNDTSGCNRYKCADNNPSDYVVPAKELLALYFAHYRNWGDTE